MQGDAGPVRDVGENGVARPSRRSVLVGATAAAAALTVAARGAFAEDRLPSTIRIYVPYGRGSVAAATCDLLQPALSTVLSRRVVVDIPPLPDRMQRALTGLAEAGGSELRLLASDTLTHVMYDVQAATRKPKAPPSLDSLVPVATLTIGYSTALFVAATSPAHDWEGFAAMAHGRELTVASTDPGSVHLRFLQRSVNSGFRDVLAARRDRVFDAVLEGRAAAGLTTTPSLSTFILANPDKVRPLVTFGGERNPELGVPTLREVTGKRGFATTNSVGLFAPAGTAPDTVSKLHEALAAAAATTDVQAAAASIGLPLRISDAADLAETIVRDRAVVSESGL